MAAVWCFVVRMNEHDMGYGACCWRLYRANDNDDDNDNNDDHASGMMEGRYVRG